MDINCIKKECSNQLNLYNLDICEKYIGMTVGNKYIPNCTYNGIRCINIQNYCSQYIGYNSEQCLMVSTLSGESCFQDNYNTSKVCRTRRCTDNLMAVNDLQCDQFLKGCITTGKGCVESTQKCNQFKGTESSCLKFIGNGNKCRGQNTITKCSVRECFHDQQSISDIECNSFMEGCVTNGKGCVSSLEPCGSYIGNLEKCSKFKGNGRLCYSDSLVDFHICRDRQCSDNSKAITDLDCNTFMPGCVSKGIGCIDDTKSCSNYYGAQIQCSKFKGEKGTKPCWNISQATSNTRCINKECNHMSRGTNDIECNSFLEGCVSDGFQCLTKRYCSQFYGTAKTCILFNALDKPCKGIDSTIQQCRQLQCIDASNNYDTDEKCNRFKSGCKTTGFGCIDFNTCEMIQQIILIQIYNKLLCLIQLYHLNNYVKKDLIVNIQMDVQIILNWDFLTKQCRDWNCSDASVLLKKHDDCYNLNHNCTTTGNGCIEISHCNQYLNKQTCLNALSLGYSKKCVWEINICRDKLCEDAPKQYTNNVLCQEISPDCITTGQGCTYKFYQCEDLNTKTNCIQDYQGNPCLWINQTQTCVTFSECSDIKKTTVKECQVYSKMCTSNGENCIAFSKCSDYTNSISCYKGTDGDCGWVIGQTNQEPRCQTFRYCSEIIGQTKEDCQYYQNTCTSDGQNCIEIGDCKQYQTKFGCNSSGKDGSCFWDESQITPICRLQQCNDIPLIPYMTYQYCSKFNPQLNCTTNEQQCINKKPCSNYLEQSCYEGTDGTCVFAYPLNQNDGTEQKIEFSFCRTKECIDYIEQTTEACSKLKSDCISDGIRCLKRLNCADYTTEIACDSDGVDGICIFDGKKNCILMSKCEDANNSYTACSKKPNVCYFYFEKKNDIEIKQCNPIKCLNSPNCSPIYNFNETQITVCIQKSQNECIEGFPYQLSENRCYSKSLHTYYWNTTTSKCERCQKLKNVTRSPSDNGYQNILTSFILIQIILAI